MFSLYGIEDSTRHPHTTVFLKIETFNKSSDRELRIVAQRKSRALKLTDVACLSMGSLLGYLAGLSGDG